MPTAQLSEQQNLFYLDENPSGNPAIFLFHGLGSNSSSWVYQIPILSKAGYRVIAIDSPGFGNSPYMIIYKDYIKGTSRCFSELVSYLNLSQLVICGLSLGGTQALQFALDYPNLVDKLILVSTFSTLQTKNAAIFPYFALRMILLYTLGLKAQGKAVARRIFPEPGHSSQRSELVSQISQADTRAYRSAMRSLSKFNVNNRLGEITCPTLVLCGEKDTTVPSDRQLDLASRIPKSTYRQIAGGGHAVTIDHPEIFNHFLLEFVSLKTETKSDY